MSRHHCLFVLLAGTLPLFTAPNASAQKPPESPAAAAVDEKPAPIPAETSSVTDHELSLDGKTVRYTANAGTLLIMARREAVWQRFYVAYTLRGVSDLRTRPITFLYNGSFGSATSGFTWGRLVRCGF
jgi:carboxypeptidase C (cathepsin A)